MVAPALPDPEICVALAVRTVGAGGPWGSSNVRFTGEPPTVVLWPPIIATADKDTCSMLVSVMVVVITPFSSVRPVSTERWAPWVTEKRISVPAAGTPQPSIAVTVAVYADCPSAHTGVEAGVTTIPGTHSGGWACVTSMRIDASPIWTPFALARTTASPLAPGLTATVVVATPSALVATLESPSIVSRGSTEKSTVTPSIDAPFWSLTRAVTVTD